MSLSFQTMNAQLSQIEKDGLIYMYEKEKPAHDVYKTLSEKYSVPIFKNITKSEAYHMSMVSELIKKYKLKYPSGKAQGEFVNAELQNLYYDLIEKGSKSLIDGLTVGATIEDIDIFDIEKLNRQVKNNDIKQLYEQLICGSENHMRAFAGHLRFRNSNYKPQHISQTRFNSIIDGKHQRCFEFTD